MYDELGVFDHLLNLGLARVSICRLRSLGRDASTTQSLGPTFVPHSDGNESARRRGDKFPDRCDRRHMANAIHDDRTGDVSGMGQHRATKRVPPLADQILPKVLKRCSVCGVKAALQRHRVNVAPKTRRGTLEAVCEYGRESRLPAADAPRDGDSFLSVHNRSGIF